MIALNITIPLQNMATALDPKILGVVASPSIPLYSATSDRMDYRDFHANGDTTGASSITVNITKPGNKTVYAPELSRMIFECKLVNAATGAALDNAEEYVSEFWRMQKHNEFYISDIPVCNLANAGVANQARYLFEKSGTEIEAESESYLASLHSGNGHAVVKELGAAAKDTAGSYISYKARDILQTIGREATTAGTVLHTPTGVSENDFYNPGLWKDLKGVKFTPAGAVDSAKVFKLTVPFSVLYPIFGGQHGNLPITDMCRAVFDIDLGAVFKARVNGGDYTVNARIEISKVTARMASFALGNAAALALNQARESKQVYQLLYEEPHVTPSTLSVGNEPTLGVTITASRPTKAVLMCADGHSDTSFNRQVFTHRNINTIEWQVKGATVGSSALKVHMAEGINGHGVALAYKRYRDLCVHKNDPALSLKQWFYNYPLQAIDLSDMMFRSDNPTSLPIQLITTQSSAPTVYDPTIATARANLRNGTITPAATACGGAPNYSLYMVFFSLATVSVIYNEDGSMSIDIRK